MTILHLRIITPKKVVLEDEIESITAPGSEGELTVLPRHVALFTMLKEGVVTIRTKGDETLFSIGGGYLETNGKEVNVLVSRAYHQDEIDEKEVETARLDAEKLIKEAPTDALRHEAMTSLRRSIIDLKVLRRRKKSVRTS